MPENSQKKVKEKKPKRNAAVAPKPDLMTLPPTFTGPPGSAAVRKAPKPKFTGPKLPKPKPADLSPAALETHKKKKTKKASVPQASEATEEATAVASPEAPQAREPTAPEAADLVSEDGATEVETLGFDDLGLSEPVVRAITALGFETPTPIQARSIPFLLAGRDLIGQAQTGTGKTAAFALPMIEKIDTSLNQTQALVLAPTRELAVQVAGGVYDLAKNSGLRVVPVYGGQPIDRQFRALRAGAHIVVGTPGRVLDHLRRGSLSLETVTYCVLDEADEMLALGFLEDMEVVLAALPAERQLAFFSATMPPRIAALTKRFLRNPEHVAIEAKRRTVASTVQTYYDVPRGKKLEALARVLDMETPGPTIVFCRTRQETNDLSEALRLRGYNAEPLNGEMSQSDRDRVMRRFREGHADLLVATDVAARGLDIDTVTHVINYDIPWDVEQYIHRIGRTGRAGRAGDAITLVEGRERRQLKMIENMIGVTIKPVRIPTASDIAGRRRELVRDALRETLEAGEFDGHMQTVEELSGDFDPSEIAAAALLMLWKSRHSAADSAAEEFADVEQPESGMTRLFVGTGRQEGMRPGDLVGTIARLSGLAGKAIGAIDILDHSSFVEVPTAEVDRVVVALGRAKFRGKKVKVQVAGNNRGRD